MSLDWGKGFGLSFRERKEASAMPQSLRNLCFFPGEATADFPFAIDKRRFLCAQIPGAYPDETYFIDLLSLHPESSMVVIDFLSYERVFISDIRTLREEILSRLEETRYAKLQRGLSDLLRQLIDAHSNLLNSIEQLAHEHAQNFIAQFIERLVTNQRILQVHRAYLERYLQMERAAISLSVERSYQLREHLRGRVIIQLIKCPIAWQNQVVDTMTKLSQILPEGIDKLRYEKQLQDYTAKVVDLTETIDSLPKLEQLSKMFVTEPFPIVVPGRRLLMRGQAKKRCRKTDSARELLLFSDIFVYTQVKGGHFLVTAKYELTHLRVTVDDGTLMNFYAPSKSFVMVFASKEDRAAWNECIQQAIENAKEYADAPIEPYIEAPIWIQDREHSSCMNCHTPFTLLNRRHHCRACGRILCSNCLSKRIILSNISQKRVKVCEQCFQEKIKRQ